MNDLNKLDTVIAAKKIAEKKIAVAMEEFLESIDFVAVEAINLDLTLEVIQHSNDRKIDFLVIKSLAIGLALKLKHAGSCVEVRL